MKFCYHYCASTGAKQFWSYFSTRNSKILTMVLYGNQNVRNWWWYTKDPLISISSKMDTLKLYKKKIYYYLESKKDIKISDTFSEKNVMSSQLLSSSGNFRHCYVIIYFCDSNSWVWRFSIIWRLAKDHIFSPNCDPMGPKIDNKKSRISS